MKTYMVIATILTSLTSFAGDRYLTCGIGQEGHWDNFTDRVLDENKKGLVTLQNELDTYIIMFNGENYRYIKSNRNQGGYEEKRSIQSDGSSMYMAHILDDVWCHIND